jgi:hypothetical protein
MTCKLTATRWMGSLLWAGALLAADSSAPASAPAVAGEKYLLLDSRVVAQTEGMVLRPGRAVKHPANPLFREDRPWEVRFDNLYANVIRDPATGLYRCWYSPFIVDPAMSETPRERRVTERYRPRNREMGVCYAESRDGLKWEKPELGLIDFRGSTRNNLVIRGPHGAGVFQDPRDPDPQRRFKMFFRDYEQLRSMAVAFSADGLKWGSPQACPEIHVHGDTHNNAFWAPELGKYVGITRLKTDQRLVARTESADFLHWTRGVEVLRGDPANQTYAMPVLRYAGVYLGLVMILRRGEDRVHCELTWSPDTTIWHRVAPGTPLIPNSDKPGDYDWGCVYAAAVPVVLAHEIRLYYGASNGPHTNWRDGFLALATLRPDGFAGWSPAQTGAAGTLVTQPITCTGSQLCVSADAAGGSLRVAVVGQEELGWEQCMAVKSNVTDGPVHWSGGATLHRLRGKKVQLKFQLQDATVYAFKFVGNQGSARE